MATTARRRPANNRYAGLPDPMVLNRLEGIQQMLNSMTSRSQLVRGRGMDVRRDIDDECGYTRTDAVTIELYQRYYDRHPIAARVVEVMPSECWSTNPEVYETEDLENETEFERAWKELPRSLNTKSWYRGQEGNPIWNLMRRVDVLCGIGRYGIILLGIDDGRELSEPVEGIEEENSGGGGTYTLNVNRARERRLLFATPYGESQVTIARSETNPTSPRYGHPTAYSVSLAEPDVSLSGDTKRVHWTRVIHVADNCGSSLIYGTERMLPVIDRLYDLRKLYGGSAEMYWKGALPTTYYETHPQLGGDVQIDTDDFKDNIENLYNGLQRWMLLEGMSAKTSSPTVVDPTPQINTQIEAICVKLAIPKRIFVGSERGELASSQDEGSWNDVIRGRQNNQLTPHLIVPFIDRLIMVGVLPEPREYFVHWPDLESLSDQEQAQLALTRTEALGKYIQGGADAMITPKDYLVRWQGMDSNEADEILESAVEEIEKEEGEKEEERAKRLEEEGPPEEEFERYDMS